MLNIHIHLTATDSDALNSTMIKFLYGVKRRILTLVEQSVLKDETATLVILISPGSDICRFVNTDEQVARKLQKLFDGDPDVKELVGQVLMD